MSCYAIYKFEIIRNNYNCLIKFMYKMHNIVNYYVKKIAFYCALLDVMTKDRNWNWWMTKWSGFLYFVRNGGSSYCYIVCHGIKWSVTEGYFIYDLFELIIFSLRNVEKLQEKIMMSCVINAPNIFKSLKLTNSHQKLNLQIPKETNWNYNPTLSISQTEYSEFLMLKNHSNKFNLNVMIFSQKGLFNTYLSINNIILMISHCVWWNMK